MRIPTLLMDSCGSIASGRAATATFNSAIVLPALVVAGVLAGVVPVVAAVGAAPLFGVSVAPLPPLLPHAARSAATAALPAASVPFSIIRRFNRFVLSMPTPPSCNQRQQTR